MKSKIISQGAEAKIILKNNLIIKDRIKKSYRIKELDEKIRKQRTKKEIKLLKKASKIINSPKPLVENNVRFPSEAIKETAFPYKKGKSKKTARLFSFDKINMSFIDGKKLSEHLDNFPIEKQKQIMKQIGNSIAKLHDANIIHGDLTTSNMILKNNEVYFIDFGLGFISHRYEDKAVDLHLLKQALEAKHFKNWKVLFNEILKEYKKENSEDDKVLKQFEKVEKRGRYKKG